MERQDVKCSYSTVLLCLKKKGKLGMASHIYNPALKRLRQEDHKFKASCLKKEGWKERGRESKKKGGRRERGRKGRKREGTSADDSTHIRFVS
jgi:hypothetical protein